MKERALKTSDGYIYALNIEGRKELLKFEADKAVHPTSMQKGGWQCSLSRFPAQASVSYDVVLAVAGYRPLIAFGY